MYTDSNSVTYTTVSRLTQQGVPSLFPTHFSLCSPSYPRAPPSPHPKHTHTHTLPHWEVTQCDWHDIRIQELINLCPAFILSVSYVGLDFLFPVQGWPRLQYPSSHCQHQKKPMTLNMWYGVVVWGSRTFWTVRSRWCPLPRSTNLHTCKWW